MHTGLQLDHDWCTTPSANLKSCTYTILAAQAQTLLCEGMMPPMANCKGCIYTSLAVGTKVTPHEWTLTLPVGSFRVPSQVSTAALQHR